MPPLTVLIANATLATLTGTETYVRDLGLGLLRKGHRPIVYAPDLGPIAEELRRTTIPVVDNLNSVATTPDVIHGNHNTETITALLHFAKERLLFSIAIVGPTGSRRHRRIRGFSLTSQLTIRVAIDSSLKTGSAKNM